MGFHNGLFRISGKELTVTGCDNYRLAVSHGIISADEENEEEIKLIIPGKFLRELLHLLNDTDEEVAMTLGRKHVIFKFGELCFFTRILEIEYPDYEKMLPSAYTTQVYLSRTEFLEAIERSSIVAEAKLGGIGKTYVKLEFTDNTVRISSVSSSGAIEEILSVDITGTNLTIGFECRNLLETLKAIPKECNRLRLRMNASVMGITIEAAKESPFVDSEENEKTLLPDEKNRFMYYVLPTRITVPQNIRNHL
jgi:DNA polymerase-3 subunit beta